MSSNQINIEMETISELENYYRFHSKIYDYTRWSFLFGRSEILEMLPPLPVCPHILEIGCGTGSNFSRILQHSPDAQITGIDSSPSMLSAADKKFGNRENVKLINDSYPGGISDGSRFDLILCSYSLTMFDNDMKSVFYNMKGHLKPGGQLAIVDFHTSPFFWFRKWMNFNHVSMEGNILPMAKSYFNPEGHEIKKAYGGLWSYVLFTGTKKE